MPGNWGKFINLVAPGEYFQQWTLPSKKYTMPKTTMNPRQPPPHLLPAYPAMIVLQKLFIANS
jgi:hypothetical protein